MKFYHATDKKHLASILHDDCVILEIDGTKLDENSFGPDDFELQDVMDMGDLADFETWIDVPWKQSLEVVHQIAYFETVLPEEILRYKYKGRWQKPNFKAKVTAFYIIAEEITEEPVSISVVKQLRHEMASAAQKVYDDWVLDEHGYHWEVGGGGICHLIADAMADVLHKHNVDAYEVSSHHEVHVYLVVRAKEGVFNVDIPYSIYEKGGGYSWKKIEGVQFEPDDVVVDLLDHDPGNLKEYVDAE